MTERGDHDRQRRSHIDWIADPNDRGQVAWQAVEDTRRLAAHLRDRDPAEVWAELCRHYRNDPRRLVALTFAALAATPSTVDGVVSLLNWTTRHLTRDQDERSVVRAVACPRRAG